MAEPPRKSRRLVSAQAAAEAQAELDQKQAQDDAFETSVEQMTWVPSKAAFLQSWPAPATVSDVSDPAVPALAGTRFTVSNGSKTSGVLFLRLGNRPTESHLCSASVLKEVLWPLRIQRMARGLPTECHVLLTGSAAAAAQSADTAAAGDSWFYIGLCEQVSSSSSMGRGKVNGPHFELYNFLRITRLSKRDQEELSLKGISVLGCKINRYGHSLCDNES